MGQKIITTLICDIGGEESPDAETVTIYHNGKYVALELCPTHKGQYDKALAKYLEKSRKAEAPAVRGGGRARRASSNGTKVDLSEVRQWARAKGYSVNDRGRVPADIMEEFKAEQVNA